MFTNPRTALILGVTGGIGGEVTRALLSRGWKVKALHRDPVAARAASDVAGEIEWLTGDAMNRDDVVAAARGATALVHAVNPPKYHDWRGLALPMLENTIAAAKAHGARIVFPGTIYNFGTEAFPMLRESSPQYPHTRKGKIRVEMEQRLQAAAAEGVRTLVLRAGDFFGPRAGNNWFSQGLLAGRKTANRTFYPGPRDLGHSWAYLPDLAETMTRLLEMDDRLDAFAVFHFEGHWLERGVEIAESICRVSGQSATRIHAFPWWLVQLASPFVEMCREMLEMRYLWQHAARLDNSKLRALIGEEPHTPLDLAVARTLTGNGVGSAGSSSATRQVSAITRTERSRA